MTMPEELSLGEPATETAPASPFGTPNPASAEPAAPAIDPPVVSIVDTILQLNAFMSADVRRAEKTARFCSKPWLEADIDELVFELEGLVDDLGNPLPAGEHAIGEQVRTPEQVALEIQTLQAEMGAAFVSVRMAQLPSDDWQEFRTKWRKVIEGPPPYANEMYNELIEVSAKTPTITAEQAAKLRTTLGHPQMDTLAAAAWAVNTESGVSIPKSQLSSLVLRRAARGQS
jgi:hypothetical protein